MKTSTSRTLLGLLFIAAGANHFRSPQPYIDIMPDYLPAHEELVALSGLTEIAGGLGVLFSPTRRAAGWGLILLLLAVYPANIHAALNGMEVFGKAMPRWLLWARLPLQFLMWWWVYRACIKTPSPALPLKRQGKGGYTSTPRKVNR